jgi:hypothetical protein
LWYKVAIGILTLPLLQLSCVEISQRALIDGFFNAVTPLLNEHLENRLIDVLSAGE